MQGEYLPKCRFGLVIIAVLGIQLPQVMEPSGDDHCVIAKHMSSERQCALLPTNGDAAEVEGIRALIRANADRRDSAPADPVGLDSAPLDQGFNPAYSYDDEREGIVQAPYPVP